MSGAISGAEEIYNNATESFTILWVDCLLDESALSISLDDVTYQIGAGEY